MTLLPGFTRVTKQHPCPVCSSKDWCLVEGPRERPYRAYCPRTESGRRAGALGWVHILDPDHAAALRPVSLPRERKVIDHDHWSTLAKDHLTQLDHLRLVAFAEGLGLTPWSLRRLDVGWTGNEWSFPMRDEQRRVVGIRLRRPQGLKFAVRGSSTGLFIPRGVAGAARLFVPEGPTDTSALLDLGLAAVGRPSCDDGGHLVERVVNAWDVAEIAVVADRDEPGRKGAGRLADRLVRTGRRVVVVLPPSGSKDVREALSRGLQARDLEAAFDEAARNRGGQQ